MKGSFCISCDVYCYVEGQKMIRNLKCCRGSCQECCKDCCQDCCYVCSYVEVRKTLSAPSAPLWSSLARLLQTPLGILVDVILRDFFCFFWGGDLVSWVLREVIDMFRFFSIISLWCE